MSYLFGMGNLLAGPFYEFTDYKQFIELKGVSSESSSWGHGLLEDAFTWRRERGHPGPRGLLNRDAGS